MSTRVKIYPFKCMGRQHQTRVVSRYTVSYGTKKINLLGLTFRFNRFDIEWNNVVATIKSMSFRPKACSSPITITIIIVVVWMLSPQPTLSSRCIVALLPYQSRPFTISFYLNAALKTYHTSPLKIKIM